MSNTYYSQDYIPFPDSVATWNVNQFYYDFEDEVNFNRASNFHIQGDSIINDTIYSKLYARMSRFGDLSYSQNTHPYILLGLIREDANKKVWYKNLNFNNWQSNPWPMDFFISADYGNDIYQPLIDSINLSNEIILYDFGLEVGDSVLFPGDIEVFEPYWATVEEANIDIFGRRTIKFSYPYDCWLDQCARIWVEGIGDIRSHPFSLYEMNEFLGLGLGFGYNLNCFWVDGEQVYATENDEFLINCENLIVGTREIEQNSLSIYPNPSSGRFVIEMPVLSRILGTQRTFTLSVINALGEEVLRYEELFEDRLEIDLSSFSNGVYMVLLESEGGVYSSKIVKE